MTTDSHAGSRNSIYRIDRSGEIACLHFPLLESVSGVRHAVTTRQGGHSTGVYASANMGLSVGDDPETVLANRELAAQLVGGRGVHPVTVRQVHGVNTAVAHEPGRRGEPIAAADMLLTMQPGIPLMVQAADCLPIILIDPTLPAVGVVHAGWRGIAASAGREAIAAMQRQFQSVPENLVIAVGPGIGQCCYEVSDEVAQAIAVTVGCADDGLVDRTRGERPFIDIGEAALAQLTAAGVPRARVAHSRLCTACNLDLFYSHRREGMPAGRFAALVMIDHREPEKP